MDKLDNLINKLERVPYNFDILNYNTLLIDNILLEQSIIINYDNKLNELLDKLKVYSKKYHKIKFIYIYSVIMNELNFKSEIVYSKNIYEIYKINYLLALLIPLSISYEIYKKFNLNNLQIDFIKNNISKYYKIKKIYKFDYVNNNINNYKSISDTYYISVNSEIKEENIIKYENRLYIKFSYCFLEKKTPVSTCNKEYENNINNKNHLNIFKLTFDIYDSEENLNENKKLIISPVLYIKFYYCPGYIENTRNLFELNLNNDIPNLIIDKYFLNI